MMGALAHPKVPVGLWFKLAVLLFGEAMLGRRHEVSLQEQTWTSSGSVCFISREARQCGS